MCTAVLLIFMFGNLSEELYQVIIQHSDLSPSYKVLFKQLKESKTSGLVSVSLVSNFEKLIQETINYNWKKDLLFMLPSWVVYFLERLLFLVSSWHGSFFTLKSSVRETIPWGDLRCNSSSLSEADSKVFSRRYDIITVLPPEFAKILEKRGRRPNHKLLADILKEIGDPLVFLKAGNIQREFLIHNVLVIDVDMIHSREDILGILYPKNSECDGNDEMEYGSPSVGNVCFSSFDHTSYTEYAAEFDDDIPDYNIERTEFLDTETGEFSVAHFMQLFTNTSRVYMFWKRILEDISFHDCKPQMKLDICICLLENDI
ncbi:hypothetical protein MKW98_007149 [Papaver atlanticum]|uniref:Uncharacterized protein n=1 Tax=Papaver atlanticum TaxID=357466 RepID=A0AAD4XHI0_9MAGN|nr:hypothetical protein MKW98_007149 [Papaver atlanticum]